MFFHRARVQIDTGIDIGIGMLRIDDQPPLYLSRSQGFIVIHSVRRTNMLVSTPPSLHRHRY
jgi:hypothetical protein